MKNPEFMNTFNNLMKQPGFMDMAQNVFKSMNDNPQMLNQMMSQINQPLSDSEYDFMKNTKQYQNNSKIRDFVEDMRKNGRAVGVKYATDPEVQSFLLEVGKKFNPAGQGKSDIVDDE